MATKSSMRTDIRSNSKWGVLKHLVLIFDMLILVLPGSL